MSQCFYYFIAKITQGVPMKKKIIITALALISTQAFCADFRDASLIGSSNTSDFVMEKGASSMDGTMKIADLTAEKLKALISNQLASTGKASAQVARAIVQLSDISQPVFKITGDGLAMAFRVSGQTANQSLDASKKLLVIMDPTLKVSGKALAKVLEKMFEGSYQSSKASSKIFDLISKESRISSDVTNKILEILAKTFEKPLEMSSDATDKINDLLTKGSETGSDVSTKVIGKKNIEAGFELSGEGLSLTSKGIGAVFYVITKGVTGISHIFERNKEEIQKAVERNDQETLAGLRELIRAEINASIENGETLNQLLSDADIDQYIELRLAAEEL